MQVAVIRKTIGYDLFAQDLFNINPTPDQGVLFIVLALVVTMPGDLYCGDRLLRVEIL